MVTAALFDLDFALTDQPATVRQFTNRFLNVFGDRLAGDASELAAVITAADRSVYRPFGDRYPVQQQV